MGLRIIERQYRKRAAQQAQFLGEMVSRGALPNLVHRPEIEQQEYIAKLVARMQDIDWETRRNGDGKELLSGIEQQLRERFQSLAEVQLPIETETLLDLI